MPNSLVYQENCPRRILVLGGKHQFNQIALRYEGSRKDGHTLFFAHSVQAAWDIVSTTDLDRITIEAFMENSARETPFHFLDLIKNSVYSSIPILIVAAEPSSIGISLATGIRRAANCLGAEFKLVSQFKPETVRESHHTSVAGV